MITAKHLLLIASLLPLTACTGKGEDSGLPPAKGDGGPQITVRDEVEAERAAVAKVLDSERYVGQVKAIREAEIGPKASGTIARIYVEEGEHVKKGEVLFSLDARSQRLGVEQARTALQSAILARDEAKRNLDRQAQLKDRGSISDAVFERAENGFKSAENAVEQAKVSVSLARRQTGDSAAVAPFDGLVVKLAKTIGETVTMMPPTTVILLQDQTKLELRVGVPERALRSLERGQAITAEFPAIGVTRSAVIDRIQPLVDPATRTVEVVAHIDNADGRLFPGMYVEVSAEALTDARIDEVAKDPELEAAAPAEPNEEPKP
ncbi:MAG: efflux RND transporter periplasmic adaptor subunit [Nannocystaceae bacterium]|nr:efflux RND transporter periplasmic adaptor subunit [Myxococcales bacterium]